MTKTTTQIVAAALEGATKAHLEDIAAHGIHNITNDYQGNTDEEYEAFCAEFEVQAKAALLQIENAERAACRAQ